MTLPLGRRILAWSSASTLLVLVAVSATVDGRFRTQIRFDLEENLAAGGRLAHDLREQHLTERIDAVAALAQNPVLRGSVDTRDPNTVREAMNDLLPWSGFDWLAVATPEGTLLAATRGAPARLEQRAALLMRGVRFYDAGDVWRIGGTLVDVTASALFFGDAPLGVVLAGRRIGPETVEEVESYTRQRVVFLAGDAVAAASPQLQDVSPDELMRELPAAARAGTEATTPGVLTLGRSRFLAVRTTIADAAGAHVGELVLLRSLDEAFAPVRQLRIALAVIGVIGLAGGALLAWVLSRSVTTPVARLLEETVRIGAGDLDAPVEPGPADEIGALARGFEQMRVSLHQTRAELIRAERLSAVGRAASAIVHDFAQPVTVLSGYVDLLEEVDDPGERADFFRIVRRQVENLRGMMQEVLEFARGEDSIRRGPEVIPRLVDDVARGLGPSLAEQGIRLSVEHGYRGIWLLDGARMTRVLNNLVGNAAAVVPSGGSVRLRTVLAHGRLRIEVQDDGPGIPEHIRDNLFEPFVTHGKRGGTGLGLAIVKNVMEKQGGSIDFTTSASGTTFRLELPEDGYVASAA
jgi:signal transduction histidine kinase